MAAIEKDPVRSTQAYQKRCWTNYKTSIGFPLDRTYLSGNPLKVQVPVDTASGGLFIIGAYPTAHFNTINGVRDVPVGDHLYPFSNERYFDGSSVRCVRSGEELDALFLKPLGVDRSASWITDLVKVFLFKEGHSAKYGQLGGPKQMTEDRTKFLSYAQHPANMKFLEQELELAKPKVVVLLGAEVAGVLLGAGRSAAGYLSIKEHELQIGKASYRCFACPHPGILLRNRAGSEKWMQVLQEQIPLIRKALN